MSGLSSPSRRRPAAYAVAEARSPRIASTGLIGILRPMKKVIASRPVKVMASIAIQRNSTSAMRTPPRRVPAARMRSMNVTVLTVS